MRRFVTALVSVVASLSLVACGNDGSTTDAGAAAETVAVPTTATSSTGDAPSASVDAPSDPSSLLIDSLPEITGPTVLWFWAPG